MYLQNSRSDRQMQREKETVQQRALKHLKSILFHLNPLDNPDSGDNAARALLKCVPHRLRLKIERKEPFFKKHFPFSSLCSTS